MGPFSSLHDTANTFTHPHMAVSATRILMFVPLHPIFTFFYQLRFTLAGKHFSVNYGSRRVSASGGSANPQEAFLNSTPRGSPCTAR